MKPSKETVWQVLIPFDPAEGINLRAAAARAGKSQTTIRNWCERYGIGRRVVGGEWRISKVALAMLLEDDHFALTAYLAGDRSSALIQSYFDRFGLRLPKLKATAQTPQH